ncbi:DUF6429 family protein [Variovorax sp. J22R115]|uniref:DUF6429 family protein n=1 Tax=Variovorax sp. J22R115 TaxID=3053509 RepID=UPI0025790CAE|nr:DUF6429 family protein [Variovorax sp. J22R115]MDM0050626.1 DUF6429 family protein [Variovorax sp. J22R115]
MLYDDAKIEEAVLALMGAFEFDKGRVWKGYDFGVMNALHEKGLITDPHGFAKSVNLTEDGKRMARELAARHFAIDGSQP